MEDFRTELKLLRQMNYETASIQAQLDILKLRVDALCETYVKEFSEEDAKKIEAYRKSHESLESFMTRLGFEEFLKEQDTKQPVNILTRIKHWFIKKGS